MRRTLLIAALTFSGAMHAALVPEHLREMPLVGAAFIPAAAASIALAIALILRPDNRALPALAVALLASEILIYIAVVAAHAEHVEQVALLCKLVEAAGIAAAVRRPHRLSPQRGKATVAGLAGAAAGIFATAALAAPASMSMPMSLLPSQDVSIPGRLFDPGLVIAVTGQTIDWSNADASSHTVTADGGGFDSGTMPPGGGFSWTPTRPGVYTYHCTIHRFMRGEVDVYDLALYGPRHAVGAGTAFALRGLAPAPRSPITLEDEQSGAIIATATSADDGNFTFTLTADSPATFRARTDTASSPPYTLTVAARPALTLLAHDKNLYTLSATAVPPQPGAAIALQHYIPELFRWQSIQRDRLDSRSHAALNVRSHSRQRIRAVIVDGVDGYSGGVSRELRLP